MKQKLKFVLEKTRKGRTHLINSYKGYDIPLWFPNKDAILFSALIKSLKEGGKIEIKIFLDK